MPSLCGTNTSSLEEPSFVGVEPKDLSPILAEVSGAYVGGGLKRGIVL